MNRSRESGTVWFFIETFLHQYFGTRMSKNPIFVVVVNTEQLPIVFLGTILSLPLPWWKYSFWCVMPFSIWKWFTWRWTKVECKTKKLFFFVSKFSKSFRKRIFNIYSLIFYFNSVFISIKNFDHLLHFFFVIHTRKKMKFAIFYINSLTVSRILFFSYFICPYLLENVKK